MENNAIVYEREAWYSGVKWIKCKIKVPKIIISFYFSQQKTMNGLGIPFLSVYGQKCVLKNVFQRTDFGWQSY